MRTKWTLDFLKSLFTPPPDPIPGNPNEQTSATKKGHIHKHSPSRKPKNGKTSPAQFRRLSKKGKKK